MAKQYSIIIILLLLLISCKKDIDHKHCNKTINIEGKWFIKTIDYTYTAIDTPSAKPITGTFAYNDGTFIFNSDSTGIITTPAGIFYTDYSYFFADNDSFKWTYHADTLILIRPNYILNNHRIIKIGVLLLCTKIIYSTTDSIKLDIPGFSRFPGYNMFYTVRLTRVDPVAKYRWTELTVSNTLRDSCGCNKAVYDGYVTADSFICSIFGGQNYNYYLLGELDSKSGPHSFILYNKQSNWCTLWINSGYAESTAFGSICNLPADLINIDLNEGKLVKFFVNKYEPCYGNSGDPLTLSYFDIVLTKFYILN